MVNTGTATYMKALMLPSVWQVSKVNDDLRKRIDELQAEMKKFKAVFLKQENRIRVLENKLGEMTGSGGSNASTQQQQQQQVSFITRMFVSIKSFIVNIIFIIVLLNAVYYYFRYLLGFPIF